MYSRNVVLDKIAECELPGGLFEDNEAAIFLTKNKRVSARTKHIEVKHHFIRDFVQDDKVRIMKVTKSENKYADVMLSKNVSVGVFNKLGKQILIGVDVKEAYEKVPLVNSIAFSDQKRDKTCDKK